MKKPCARRAGFTLIEVMTVMGIIGMLATIALPNFIRARSSSQERLCITNLHKIEWAKQMWAVENNKNLDEEPAANDLIGATSYLKVEPVCPSGGDYEINALGTPVTCSIEGHTL